MNEIPELNSSEKTANRAALMQQFAEWLLLPLAARDEAGLPRRQKGMAELLGVSQATLSVWKKDEKFQQFVGSHIRANFGAERLSKVIDALFETATEGQSASQVSAAKTLLGWYETERSASATELSELSDEELEMLARRELAQRTET